MKKRYLKKILFAMMAMTLLINNIFNTYAASDNEAEPTLPESITLRIEADSMERFNVQGYPDSIFYCADPKSPAPANGTQYTIHELTDSETNIVDAEAVNAIKRLMALGGPIDLLNIAKTYNELYQPNYPLTSDNYLFYMYTQDAVWGQTKNGSGGTLEDLQELFDDAVIPEKAEAYLLNYTADDGQNYSGQTTELYEMPGEEGFITDTFGIDSNLRMTGTYTVSAPKSMVVQNQDQEKVTSKTKLDISDRFFLSSGSLSASDRKVTIHCNFEYKVPATFYYGSSASIIADRKVQDIVGCTFKTITFKTSMELTIPGTKPATPSAPDIATPSDPDVATPSDPDVATPSDPDVVPPTNPDVVPPADPDVVPPTNPDVVPPTNPDVVPPANPDVVPPTDPDVVPPADPDVVPPTDPDVVPPANPDVVPPSDPVPNPRPDSGSDSENSSDRDRTPSGGSGSNTAGEVLIEDAVAPLSALPTLDENSEDMIIQDEQIPLAALPSTGDTNAPLTYAFVFLMSGFLTAVIGYSFKRKKEC